MTAVLQETFQNIRVIKSFAAEAEDERRIGKATDQVQRNLFHFRIARYAEEPVRFVADAAAVAVMMLVAYRAMAEHRISMPGFAMFVFLSRQVVTPLSELSKTFLGLFGIAGGAHRILEVFHERSEIEDGVDIAPVLASSIQLDHVAFSYNDNMPVLSDISLEIKRGEMVAIVGPSGAGKTTMMDLILRLYDPNQGAVLFDGTDVRRFKQQTYLRHFGVVSQECLLLNASVEDNIVYGRPYERERVTHALQVANALDFVESLSHGLLTEVGDRGVRLSGGQRQRIAIARAIYGRPDILMLDEATSALDTESERAVQKAIDNVVKDITAIVIAHRLSTVVHANKVVVLSEGRVVGVGSHAELLKSCPTYERLYKLQFHDAPADLP